MTTDAQWDARWRQPDAAHDGKFDTRHFPLTPGASDSLQKSNPPSQTYAHSWRGEERGEELNPYHQQHQRPQQLPPMSTAYTNSRLTDTELEKRRQSPKSNLSSATSPFDQRNAGSWHSLPLTSHTHQSNSSGPSLLTLTIPETQDLSRTSTEKQSYLNTPLSRQLTATSLPSFASFKEQTTRGDEPDEVEIAPMSARLTCHQCATLQPLIRDVAAAVYELDELVQVSCTSTFPRTLETPKDNPIQTVRWMLERLSKAKTELKLGLRRGIRYPSEPEQPSNPLKRSAWSQEDLPTAKRRQSTAFLDNSSRTGSLCKDERRPSIDQIVDSPLPSEFVPESAYPRQISPDASGRSLKALPSPSSMAYPLSGAPSVLPQAHSSPTTSYQQSVHTASTNSATSAHLADLQHQVTLKSLALQTLQSEYSSLLQKLQRERVKSQTIEKKTTVADQEVNDLTSRNEELTEQIKTLETQLEASERKRETDRSDAAREKDQWGRMLELGGRLQSKHAEEKQKLKDEIDGLAQRLSAYEKDGGASVEAIKRELQSSAAASEVVSRTPTAAPAFAVDTSSGLSSGSSSDEVASLRREVESLNSRIEILRFALEEARRHNQLLDEQAAEIIKRSGQLGAVVQNALRDDGVSQPQPPRTDVQMTPNGPPPPEDASAPSRGTESRKPSQSTTSSSVTLASIARAVSPGPAELGFHVTPSTSSPEEIIQALGPVPAPLPPFQFSAPFEPPAGFKNKRTQGSGKRSAKQPRRQSIDAVNTWMPPRMPEPLPQQQQQPPAPPPQPQSQQHQQPSQQQLHQQPADPTIALQLSSFRPLSAHAAGPPPLTRTPPYRPSPPSHHSSPGPLRGGSSPHGSAGSAESNVPFYPTPQHQGRVQLPPILPPQRSNGGHGFEGSVMPPPPRPGFVGVTGRD